MRWFDLSRGLRGAFMGTAGACILTGGMVGTACGQGSVPPGASSSGGVTGTSQNASIPSAETGAATPTAGGGRSQSTAPNTGSIGNPADTSSLGNTGSAAGNLNNSNLNNNGRLNNNRPGIFNNGARSNLNSTGRLNNNNRSTFNQTRQAPNNFFSVPAQGISPGGNDTVGDGGAVGSGVITGSNNGQQGTFGTGNVNSGQLNTNGIDLNAIGPNGIFLNGIGNAGSAYRFGLENNGNDGNVDGANVDSVNRAAEINLGRGTAELNTGVGPYDGFESVPSEDNTPNTDPGMQRGELLERRGVNNEFGPTQGSDVQPGALPIGTSNDLSVPAQNRTAGAAVADPDGTGYGNDLAVEGGNNQGTGQLIGPGIGFFGGGNLGGAWRNDAGTVDGGFAKDPAMMLMEQARQQGGRRIVTVNGQAVANANELQQLTTDLAGRRVPIGIDRNGQIETFFYDVPAATAAPSATAAARDSAPARPWPVTGAFVTTGFSGSGAQLSRVEPGSMAARAGLLAGDIVVQFNDREITSYRELADALQNWEQGTSAQLQVWRDGRSVPVTLPASGEPSMTGDTYRANRRNLDARDDRELLERIAQLEAEIAQLYQEIQELKGAENND